jgi:hypothetical protein
VVIRLLATDAARAAATMLTMVVRALRRSLRLMVALSRGNASTPRRPITTITITASTRVNPASPSFGSVAGCGA